MTHLKMPQGVGILRSTRLPDSSLRANWDAIIIDTQQKDRLLAQAVLNFTVRPKVDLSRIPLHGLIGLIGPPGTGKTSLARGLASATADALGSADFRFVEVDPHALSSAALGRSQKAVTELLGNLREHASTGPLIVLLDEVETLAANRSRLSLEANPIDVHRATDAVLAQLDHLAAECSNILFIATSNFPEAVDDAFLSRADLVVTIGLPDLEARKKIIADTLSALAEAYPSLKRLQSAPEIHEFAELADGMDGRQLRKSILSALTFSKETALHPEKLGLEAIAGAIRHANDSKGKKGAV